MGRTKILIVPELPVKERHIFGNLRLLRHLMSFRMALPVRELIIFSGSMGETAYYLCPRCKITLEREYSAFCDRCGQKLEWIDPRFVSVRYWSDCHP